MKVHVACLICAVVCFSESWARGGQAAAKRASLVVGNASGPSPQPASPTAVRARQNTAKPTTRAFARKALRFSQMSADQRKCCKLGQRAARKGYFCNLDMMYVNRYTNMEHNAKMKFHVKPVSKRAQRFMKHIETRCLKTHNKALFKKCCDTA